MHYGHNEHYEHNEHNEHNGRVTLNGQSYSLEFILQRIIDGTGQQAETLKAVMGQQVDQTAINQRLADELMRLTRIVDHLEARTHEPMTVVEVVTELVDE